MNVVIAGNGASDHSYNSVIVGITKIKSTATAIHAKISNHIGYMIAFCILSFIFWLLSNSDATSLSVSGTFHIFSDALISSISSGEKKYG
ncbi:hypothetical protein GW750_07925 [bacterium]|nr:hypothetical protein [bacterium]